MRWGWMLLIALGMGTLAGCASDPRQGLVSTAVSVLNDTANKINGVHDAIVEARKKQAKEKTWDFAEATKRCDLLAATGKNLREKVYLPAQNLKDPLTGEEKSDLVKEYKDQIREGFENLEKSRQKITQDFKELQDEIKEDTGKAELEKLRTAYQKAQSEFEVSTTKAR